MSADSIFYDVASTALDCICEQMQDIAAVDDDYPGCPCDPYVSPGEPPIDCCTTDCEGGGMLAVHIEDIFPSDNFPLAATTFEPCKAATWVAALVVTVGRCCPVMTDDGEMAKPDDMSANAALQAKDSYAVLTGLGCCLVNSPPPKKAKRRVQITGSRPIVADGGCAVIEVRAFVECGPICACTSGS